MRAALRTIVSGGGPFRRAFNNKLAAIGDSRVYQFTDNGFVSPKNSGAAHWITFHSQGAIEFRPTWNYGVSGENSEQVLARVASVPADIGNVLVWVSRNERAAGWSVQRSVDALTAIRAFFVARGQYVHFICETPAGNDDWPDQRYTGGALVAHLAVAQWLREQDGTYLTTATDAWPLLTTGGGTDMMLGGTFDGLHLRMTGSHILGRAFWEKIRSRIFNPDMSLFSPAAFPVGNWIGDNPTLGGSGGTVGIGGSGTMPASYNGAPSASETGITRIYAAVTNDRGAWNQCTVAGTPTTATPSLFIWRSAALSARAVAGQIVEASVEVEWDAGMTGFRSLNFALVATGTPTASLIDGGRDAINTDDLPSPKAGVYRARIVMPASPTDLRIYLQSYHRTGVLAGGVIRARNMGIRIAA